MHSCLKQHMDSGCFELGLIFPWANPWTWVQVKFLTSSFTDEPRISMLAQHAG
jgi:hypothetical protein